MSTQPPKHRRRLSLYTRDTTDFRSPNCKTYSSISPLFSSALPASLSAQDFGFPDGERDQRILGDIARETCRPLGDIPAQGKKPLRGVVCSLKFTECYATPSRLRSSRTISTDPNTGTQHAWRNTFCPCLTTCTLRAQADSPGRFDSNEPAACRPGRCYTTRHFASRHGLLPHAPRGGEPENLDS